MSMPAGLTEMLKGAGSKGGNSQHIMYAYCHVPLRSTRVSAAFHQLICMVLCQQEQCAAHVGIHG